MQKFEYELTTSLIIKKLLKIIKRIAAYRDEIRKAIYDIANM